MEKKVNDLDLWYRFWKFNTTYFEGIFPKSVIVYKSKLLKKKAGSCKFLRFSDGRIEPIEIAVSENYINIYPNDIDSVLLHEMVHLKLGNVLHNSMFIQEVERLNLQYQLGIKLIGSCINNVYVCKNCGKEFFMNKNMNLDYYRCNNCLGKIELKI